MSNKDNYLDFMNKVDIVIPQNNLSKRDNIFFNNYANDFDLTYLFNYKTGFHIKGTLPEGDKNIFLDNLSKEVLHFTDIGLRNYLDINEDILNPKFKKRNTCLIISSRDNIPGLNKIFSPLFINSLSNSGYRILKDVNSMDIILGFEENGYNLDCFEIYKDKVNFDIYSLETYEKFDF